MEHLGDTLRSAREAAGLSVSGLARQAGVAKAYISMIENDRLTGVPSESILRRLEAALAAAEEGGGGVERGGLVEAGAWAAAPEAVRERVEAAERRAERGERLALWLRDHAQRRKGEGGKDLDALYRSGQLSRRVREVLEPGGGATPGVSASADMPHPRREAAEPQGAAGGGWRRVGLVNKVAAGQPSEFTDLGYPADVADEYVSVPREVLAGALPDASAPERASASAWGGADGEGMFAAKITGSSMEPKYHEGDLVLFSEAVDAVSGRDCFVRLVDNDEMTFKRVYFEDGCGTVLEGDAGERATHVRLQPLNPEYEATRWDREAVAAVYRAVWKMTPV